MGKVGGNRKPQTFKNCTQCGERFGPIDRLSRRFCSYACKVAAQRGQPSKSKGQARPHTYRAASRECLTCGSMFRAVKDTMAVKQVYCSHQCYLRNRRVSQPEMRVCETLEAFGVKIKRQSRIGRWTVDAEILLGKIAVEIDGEYWHGLDKVRERDARKEAELVSRGYIVVRIPSKIAAVNPVVAIAPVAAALLGRAISGRKAERA